MNVRRNLTLAASRVDERNVVRLGLIPATFTEKCIEAPDYSSWSTSPLILGEENALSRKSMGRQQVAIQWLRLRGEEKKFKFFCVSASTTPVALTQRGTYYVVRWRRMLNRHRSISRSLPLPVVAAVMNLNFKWQSLLIRPNVPWPTGRRRTGLLSEFSS